VNSRLEDFEFLELFDVIICVGSFNIKTENHMQTVESALVKAVKHSSKKVIFFLLEETHPGIAKTPQNYYFSPGKIVEFARSQGWNFRLHFDYLPHDFCIEIDS
jgi:hypothetical protein